MNVTPSPMGEIFALPLGRNMVYCTTDNLPPIVHAWYGYCDGNQAQRWDQRNAWERMGRTNVRQHIAARNAARIPNDRF